MLRGGRGAHGDQFTSGPFAVALEDYAARLPGAGRSELALRYPALARFVPSLRSQVPLQALVPDPRGYQVDLVPSIVQLLTDLASEKPVLLVLGDLNELDEVGLDLTRYLAHLAARVPLLIAGALRDIAVNSCRETNRRRRRSGISSPIRWPSRVTVKDSPCSTASMISRDLVRRSRWVISG